MNLSSLVEYARQRYNAVSDSFFTDSELYRLIWAAQMELARNARCIEQTYTTSTVAGQQEYIFPTYTIAIKRVTYGGLKLMPITFREDDALTLNNQTTTAQGTPQYYALWKRTIILRPIPAAVDTLKIYSFNEPEEVTSSSSLEVPSQYHHDLVEYMLWAMASKDQNFEAASFHRKAWDEAVKRCRDDHRKNRRGDGFTAVQDMDTLPITIIGAI